MKLFWPSELSVEIFLHNYWQKRPLLLRQALPDVENCFEADEIAGLCFEDEIESRLITHTPETDSWSLRHGPFSETDFSRLPADNWTLLVQDVDKYVPEADQLLSLFRFVPDWRIDDLMISFAEDGGSVGPHTDSYDVFLIQLKGQRLWQIESTPQSPPVLRNDTEVKIMQSFNSDQEWLLSPGDVLYLPAGIPHWGRAVGGDCMTGSVGFVSPSQQQIFDNWALDVLGQIPAEVFFKDHLSKPVANPGEIRDEDIQQLKNCLLQNIQTNDDFIIGCFGRLLSEVKTQLQAPVPNDWIITDPDMFLSESFSLYRYPGLRLYYKSTAAGPRLFANGQEIIVQDAEAEFISHLCNNSQYALDDLSAALQNEANRKLLADLINSGFLLIEE